MGNQKGAQFERDICRRLSMWWSGGEADDLFWRSAGSGGLATRRKKNGQTQKSQHGDIVATDARGADLTDRYTIECKRGYGRCSFLDIIDSKTTATQTITQFIAQAKRECSEGGRQRWLLIIQRDRRKPVIVWERGEGMATFGSPALLFYDSELCSYGCTTLDLFLEYYTKEMLLK